MNDKPENPLVAMIEGIFKTLGEILLGILSVIPKILSFVLWVLCAIIILPCVFIANNLYPLWITWGEDF